MNKTTDRAGDRRWAKLWRLAFLGVLVALAGCGYSFSGGGDLPSGAQAVYVEVFANKTSETGIENTLTNDFIYEINRAGKTVTDSAAKAGAVIQGVIRDLRVETIARQDVLTAQERRVALTVDLKMTDPSGKVLWYRRGITDNEAFDVSDDKLATENNRAAAISRLSKRLAERLYYRLTDDF